MTIAEDIQIKMARREELRRELFAIENELIEAGAILSVTVASAGLLRRRGRAVQGNSCRALILAIVSDGKEWASRDIAARVAVKYESVSAQLSRMVAEGELYRVRNGWYQTTGSPMSNDAVACAVERGQRLILSGELP